MGSIVIRRRAVGLGLAGLSAGWIAGCGVEQAADRRAAWSFVDARGKRITADHQPRRIVAYSGIIGALADYGVRFAGVYGPHSPVDGKPNPHIGDAKLDGVASISDTAEYGDFDAEQVLAVRPDLVLEKSLYQPPIPFSMSKEVLAKLEPVVPVALLDFARGTLPELLRKYAKLADSLGGSPNSPRAVADRERFDAATKSIRQRAAKNRGLRVLVLSGSPQNAYIFRPSGAITMKYLQAQGMRIVEPPSKQAINDSFIEISWEQLSSYPTDVVWYDARPQAMTRQRLMEIPTFRNLPVARAGQVVPLNLEVPFSYRQWAKALEPVADWVGRFRAGLA